MTLTFEMNPDWIKLKHHAICRGQRSFHSNEYTQRTDRVTRTTALLVGNYLPESHSSIRSNRAEHSRSTVTIGEQLRDISKLSTRRSLTSAPRTIDVDR